MLFETLLLLYTLPLQGDCKILRIRDHYVARFVLIDSDFRIKSNCIRNITKFTTPQECSFECINEKDCLSINRHRELGICELIAISKFNESGLLRRDLNWVHFETDDDEQNVGSLCVDLSPCQPYEICEMTFECDPAFECRCRDGFIGEKCETYEGPGTEKSNPAASCHLLMSKFKSVPDDEYWFKGQDKKIRCERRVDGGYTKWSSFTPCSYYPCGGYGTQQRKRSCSNPSPKGAGSSCGALGPEKEVKRCYTECPDCSAKFFFESDLTLKKGYWFATIGKMLKEYKIELDFKIKDINDLASYWNNIIAFNLDGTYRTRHPSLYTKLFNGKTLIHVCFVDKIPQQRCFDKNEDLSFITNWVHIKISQTKMEGADYVFKVALNGKEVQSFVNKHPKEVRNMRLFLSSPNYASIATIRNIYLEGVCDLVRK